MHSGNASLADVFRADGGEDLMDVENTVEEGIGGGDWIEEEQEVFVHDLAAAVDGIDARNTR
jgi:hypothetical protein